MLALTTRMRSSVCLWGMFAVGFAQAATIYRYTDSSGEVVFSSTPPPGAAADRLVVESAAAPKAAPSPAPAIPSQVKQPAPEGPSPETRAKNCERARHALAELEKSPRLRVRNKEGYEYYMDGEERARRIATAEKSVAAWCDSSIDGAQPAPDR